MQHAGKRKGILEAGLQKVPQLTPLSLYPEVLPVPPMGRTWQRCPGQSSLLLFSKPAPQPRALLWVKASPGGGDTFLCSFRALFWHTTTLSSSAAVQAPTESTTKPNSLQSGWPTYARTCPFLLRHVATSAVHLTGRSSLAVFS